jgi:hypothetical protein
MLGGFSIGSAVYGGKPSTAVTIYVPNITAAKPRGEVDQIEGNLDIKNFEDSIEFV